MELQSTSEDHDGSRTEEPELHPTKWYSSSRYGLVIMGFLGFANIYSLRVNLSIAIVSMVNHTALSLEDMNLSHTTSNNSEVLEVCPKPNSTEHKPDQDGPFVWNESQQGFLLGSFFMGYIITQYPGGRLAEIFGGKLVFNLGVLVAGVFTLLTPIAANTDFSLLIAIRIIEGLGEGVAYPSMLALLAKWAPKKERSMMVSFIYSGISFGTLISTPIAGQLSKSFGWEYVFYFLGTLALIWCITFHFLCFDSPEKHPRISEEERTYIQTSLADEEHPNLSTPWLALLSSMPFWSLAVTHIAYEYTHLSLLTELPTYMNSVLHYNIKDNGNLIAILYLLSWIVGIISPIVADYAIDKGYISRTAGRKMANSLGTFGPAFALIGVTFSGCDTLLIMCLLATANGCMGAVFAGQHSNMLDIAPNYAGSVMGILNTLGNTMGFIAPQVTGAIINHNQTLPRWYTVFYVAAGINIFGNLFYLVFGDAAEQPWNNPELTANIVGEGSGCCGKLVRKIKSKKIRQSDG